MAHLLGIDLGTTTTIVARIDASGAPEVVRDWEGLEVTPTAVAFEGLRRKVTQVLALRREYGVFSASEGPRTLWEIETEDAALVLSFS
ncbi:MAG: Hsp70 family protein, partial [Opitutales bacterium]